MEMPISTYRVRSPVRPMLVAGGVLGALCLCGCGNTESDVGNSGGTISGTGSASSTSSGGATTGGASDVGGAASGTGGTASGTAAEMCETFPAALAEHNARCYGGTPEEWRSYSDNPCAATARSESAGRISFDAERAQACLAFLAADDCLFQAGEENPCNAFVTGSIPEEEPCEHLGFGDECAPGLFCDGSACIGRCRAYAQVGDTCHGNLVTAVCAPGLQCDGPSAVCLVPGAAGGACAGGGLCEAGHYCDLEDGDPGTCRPVKTEGTCPDGSGCAPGFKCLDSGSGEPTCVRVKVTGEACTFGLRECARYCSFDRVCRVVAQEGEPCGSMQDSLIEQPLSSETLAESATCAAGLLCDRNSDSGLQGICRPQAIVGEVCPATRLSGSPCQMGDEITYCSDSDECASCGSTN